MSELLSDLRYALRGLTRRPGFAAAAVLSLGLGIGANTAIYSLIDAVLLRPLPVLQPDRLVSVYTASSDGFPYSNPGYPDYEDYATGTDALSGLAAYSSVDLSLGSTAGRERLTGELVTGNYFSVLGVRAELGRTLLPDDDRAGHSAAVAVLSHRLWTRRFGADPGVVGQEIELNGHPFTVVGVAPAGFRGVRLDEAPDVWTPIHQQPILATGFFALIDAFGQRGIRWLNCVGRLAPGRTIDEARTELEVVARRLATAYPQTNKDRGITVVPATTAAALSERGDLVRFSAILAAVVAITLLIACANVANLLIARAVQRRREMGVRRALGAGRARLVRQLLTESVVLALLGGGLGLLLAAGAFDLLSTFRLPGDVRVDALALGLDGHVLAFAVGLSIFTGLLFGLAPALETARSDVMTALKRGGARSGAGPSRLRGGLVAAQIALCLLLLVGAGLFVRALRNAVSIDPGFDAGRVLEASFNLGLQGYGEAEAQTFHRRLVERAAGLPGVESAATVAYVPVNPRGMKTTFTVVGYQPAPDEDMELNINVVSPGYFRTMGIPLRAGRDFTEADRADAPGVVIVNAAFARRFWPGEDPLGKRVSRSGPNGPWEEVVGVVADSRYRSLQESPLPYAYLPLEQNAGLVGLNTEHLVVRAAGDPSTLAGPIREAARSLDPAVPLADVRPVADRLGGLLMPQRMGLTLLGLLGALALTLATIGVYGVVSFTVARRSREISIRAALGARPGEVVRWMLGRSLVPVAIGLVLGLGVALLTAGTLSRFLYGIDPGDPVTYALVGVLLLTAATAASWIPARRAAHTDPAAALRVDDA